MTDHKPVPFRCTVKVLPSAGARNTMVSVKEPGAVGPNSMGYFKNRFFLQQGEKNDHEEKLVQSECGIINILQYQTQSTH